MFSESESARPRPTTHTHTLLIRWINTLTLLYP